MPLYPVLYQPLPWRDHSILLSLATHLASLLLNTTRCTSWNYDPALSLLKKSKKKKEKEEAGKVQYLGIRSVRADAREDTHQGKHF